MVQSIKRSLLLLELLNSTEVTTVSQLNRMTKLPKSTIVRILQTLSDLGYVSKSSVERGYLLTSRVQALSAGYQETNRVIEVGRPLLEEFTAEYGWPLAVGVFDRDAVVVRYSTTGKSPISPRDGLVNKRLSMLTRGMGRAYLAYCPQEVFDYIVTVLKLSKNPEDKLVHDPDALAKIVSEVRSKGYALRCRDVEPRNSSTIAVPIMRNGRPISVLGMTYFVAAVRRSGGTKRFGKLISDLADQISRKL